MIAPLWVKLQGDVGRWRDAGYPCGYPGVGEILSFNTVRSVDGAVTHGFLRAGQFEAVEVYWYLRVVEGTPSAWALYRMYYDNPRDLSSVMEFPVDGAIPVTFDDFESLVVSDDDFVVAHGLEAVRESLNLPYPSWIFGLAMGAGKTFLIGAIIAMELALSFDHPDGFFIENALVFAPGKTILGALREMLDLPVKHILPARYMRLFKANVKFVVTRDNEKDIQTLSGSRYNVIITNTEKIRIQRRGRRVADSSLLSQFNSTGQLEADEIANLRLAKLASLPNLGIFSDEAHHVYGKHLDKELKKVRKTVNFLSSNTRVVLVVNTTGTPFFRKRPLIDVIYWYGLSRGIRDGILKEVTDGIITFEDVSSIEFSLEVLKDFIRDYDAVRLPGGALAKLAMYFPKTSDIAEVKPHLEKLIVESGWGLQTMMVVHNKVDGTVKDRFNNRMNDPAEVARVLLLVNMGTEGWNCPSLFATALARKLKNSNNFVLQAASRCLRQVPGNHVPARIYLSPGNEKILRKQLRETYDESLAIMNSARRSNAVEVGTGKAIPVPGGPGGPGGSRSSEGVFQVDFIPSCKDIVFSRPDVQARRIKKRVSSLGSRDGENGAAMIHSIEGVEEVVDRDLGSVDAFTVSVEFSSTYRLDPLVVLDSLMQVYPGNEIPEDHVAGLQAQLESQVSYRKSMIKIVEADPGNGSR
ncbi:MAG: DEAD/DEAH box helicase family protein [Promethearchaeota archaeon]